MSAAWPIDKALSAALLADGALSAKLAGDKLYSLVAPKNSAFDYLVLGDSPEVGFRTFGRAGHDTELAIHIWSRGQQRKGVLSIYGDIERVLDNKRLTLDGHTMGLMRTRLQSVLTDPDGITCHGVVRARVVSLVG